MNTTIQHKVKLAFLTLVSVMSGVFLVSLATIIINTQVDTEKSSPIFTNASAVSSETTTEEAPQYVYLRKNTTTGPSVSALAYLVADVKTGEIILEKNKDMRLPIASVSKLMTATVASEIKREITRDEIVEISKLALDTEGKNGNFKVNEKITVNDMLYPLLLESSNDAAEALALHTGRSFFVNKMNEKAKVLGLVNTSFEDPTGLSSQNKSTPNDLFKLTKHIYEQNSEIFKITTNRSFKNDSHVWFNNNQFARTEGYLGGKSGYASEARQTGAFVFSLPLSALEPRQIAITILRSTDRQKDIESIVAYLKKNVSYGTKALASETPEPEKPPAVIPPPEPEPKTPDFVTLGFAGDLMLDRGVKSSVMKNFNGDYSMLFEKLEMIKKPDIMFANLEGTASDKGKDGGSLYSFQMDPSVIPALKGAGIDVLSMANNHVADWGIESFTDTLLRLKENEILYTGAGLNLEEAIKPTIIEKHGIKIGYLGFSDVGPHWMPAKEETAGLLLTNNPKFDEIIKNASYQVDFLVVSFHFGDEYKPTHNQRQETLAKRAVDAGAKIVIGHHPHVIQEIQVYKDSFIAYSLGNFIFDQKFSPETMEGMLLEIKLWEDGRMTTKQNVMKMNSLFQPDKIISGPEEQVEFEQFTEIKTNI